MAASKVQWGNIGHGHKVLRYVMYAVVGVLVVGFALALYLSEMA